MKSLIVIFLLIATLVYGIAQVTEAHLTLAAGNAQGTASLLGGYNWQLGTNKKFAVGLGARFTSYFGSDQYYRTAPAKLTTGSTGPLVIFKEDIQENIDSVLIAAPQVNSFNVFINLRYAFTNTVEVGFNIDAIGFSFGSSTSGVYYNFPATTPTNTKPATFNLLLISDNDMGSLNSEFYLTYLISAKWALKAAAQFHFTEYRTDTDVQQFPEPNDRFRNKSLMAALGLVRRW